MAKDPAFLFYDGDAARDVSHMNRLERGCYFDLIQAQRKFGGYTVEQARKILGKDFETCWEAIELVLSKDGDQYFIEWVRSSISQRKEHADKQRKRIQDYWDKKKREEEERLNHGNTTVLPLEDEDEIEDEVIVKIDYNNVIELYHTLCPKLSKVAKVSDDRKKHINARLSEFGIEKFTEVLRLAGESDFLNGKNERTWKADFDFIINPNKFIKILEGKYSNKQPTHQMQY